MTHYGYARVLTDGQTLEAQIEALNAVGCSEIFQERISGAKADRPQLARLLAKIGKGDLLTVTRFVCLARSTRELLNILDALAKCGAKFRSIAESWADTATPDGRLMSTVLGGLAEFERELIRSRTGEGRERAKARGQHMGRRPRLTPQEKTEAIKALKGGNATQADLARRFNVSPSTISRLSDKALPAQIGRIDADTERAVRAFLKRIEGKYPVVDALLYGSRARGDYKPESDADLAVILKGKPGDRYKVSGEFAAIEFHVLMETGVMVQGFPLWEDELARPEHFTNPALIQNILREGVHL